jgi:RNA polymerase sigma-70 factor (ECF subfamily)
VADRGRQYLLLADEDLISLVEARDVQAFAALYDRHSRAAYSLAYRMMGERQAAEDLVQDAFLKVWRAAGSYRAERGSVRTWLLSIVHNRGIDQLRSLGAAAGRRRRSRRPRRGPSRAKPSRRAGATPSASRCERPSKPSRRSS